MSELTIRALTPRDAEATFTALPDGSVGAQLLGRPYALRENGGQYRAEWTFVAERAGTVVARAAFWAGPEENEPRVLDWFDVAPGEEAAGTRLLSEIPVRAEYELVLPPGWREEPGARAEAEARMGAAQAAGYVPLVERYRYRWRSADGLPELRPGRLVFESGPDDEAVLDVLRRVEQGTLDAHGARAVAEGGVEQAAREELEFFHWMDSPRAWWQLAYTPGGELVGLHVPGRNPHGPIVGFLGVVPEERGRGYGYDLLAACTHVLVAEGATQIDAATDTGNLPMAASFARAGYPVIQHRFCMTAPPGV